MTNDESNIQQARDALAKWRGNVASPLPWRIVSVDESNDAVVDAEHIGIVALSSREEESSAGLYAGDDVLIVGTAGNPDLLDALDELLAEALAVSFVQPHTVATLVVQKLAERIAAAIIVANERMGVGQ